jgi:ABC-2 type transport system permease protein/lipopolysaccharide transport system permease protein
LGNFPAKEAAAKPMLYTEYDSTRRMTLFSYIRRNIAEMHTYRYAYYNLVKNMLRTRYRRSALGFLWTLVNPLLNLTVIAVVFSIIFKMDMAVFGRYVFSGLTPWTFISTGLIQGTMSLVASEAFMKKVHLPKIMFPLVYISVEGINFLFSLISIYIIFLFIGAKLSWVMLLLPFAAIILFLFVAGCAMLLSVAYVYFRDTFNLTQVIVNALFYSVPIIYPLEQVPEQFKAVFMYNPLYQFINLFRAILYDLRVPTLSEWLIPLGLALLVLLAGTFVMMKKEGDIIFRL